MSDFQPAPWTETAIVGKPLPRVDAYERVSGGAEFALDVTLPGMLHAAIVRCPFAHARVKRTDIAKAEKMPGVRGILTVDSPEAKLPWYFTEKGPLSQLLDPHCRYAGEEVAAVAADTEAQAVAAARAIVVDYEELPFVVDYTKALDAAAPAIHEGGNRVGEPSHYERGDVKAGFASADAVVEMTFDTPCEVHTPLERHGSVARWDGDELTVWDTTQGVFIPQEALAQYFRLPLSKVRVESHYMGGGFGSKVEPSKHNVIAAALARRTGRPVRCFVSREESFLCVGNRPPNRLTLKAGAKKDGTLRALDLVTLGTSGAYVDDASNGFLVTDLYQCPNVRTEETNVHINAGKSRAFRAPGFPQCSWALEQVMDALADKLGIDPVELRLKNIPIRSQRSNAAYTSTGLARCLQDGAQAFGWKEARARARGNGPIVRGVGVAAGMWGWDGEAASTAVVRLSQDGSVQLNFGASDLGTGAKTVFAMIVAEELGVEVGRIRVENADSATTSYAPVAAGSQTVIINSPAVRQAALEVKRQVLEMAGRQLGKPPETLTLKGEKVESADGASVAVRELRELQQQRAIVGVGHRHPKPPGKVSLPFVVHFAEVEVDTRTGETRVLRMLGAHDSGRVMNALTYENQVFGGMVMGIGFGMTEERVIDRNTGQLTTRNWQDYKLPTIKDAPPEMTCLPIDPHDTESSTVGAKGLGEPATIPTAAAIANAFHHATGVRITSTPINPTRLAGRLAKAGR
jgi:xanthine dehydrogenase YagR molybdenum-binding subunit